MKMQTKTGWMKVVACVCLSVVLAAGILLPIQAKAKGYSFTYNRVSVSPGDTAAKFVKAAGDPEKKTKTNSCATKGYDYTYTYADFVLKTYTNTKKSSATEYVNSIILKTGKVKTPEGLKVGSKESEIKRKYRGAKGKYGVYSLTKGSTKIIITVEKRKVSEIEIVKK